MSGRGPLEVDQKKTGPKHQFEKHSYGSVFFRGPSKWLRLSPFGFPPATRVGVPPKAGTSIFWLAGSLSKRIAKGPSTFWCGKAMGVVPFFGIPTPQFWLRCSLGVPLKPPKAEESLKKDGHPSDFKTHDHEFQELELLFKWVDIHPDPPLVTLKGSHDLLGSNRWSISTQTKERLRS